MNYRPPIRQHREHFAILRHDRLRGGRVIARPCYTERSILEVPTSRLWPQAEPTKRTRHRESTCRAGFAIRRVRKRFASERALTSIGE